MKHSFWVLPTYGGGVTGFPLSFLHDAHELLSEQL